MPPDSKPIRVGIDGRELALSSYTGIGRYITELCKVLHSRLPHASFFVYSNHPVRMPVESSRWASRIDRLTGVEHLHSLVWLMLRAGALCARDHIDVFWGSMTILPRLPTSAKAIVTVYDLIHMDKTLVSLKRRLSYALLFKRSLAHASAITAISETTAHKVRAVLGYNVSAVIRPAVSERYQPRPAAEVKESLRAYGIATPYIFTVASSYQPRKNLGLLFEAFCQLREDGVLQDYILLVAGAGGPHALAASRFAQTAEFNGIRSLGQVPDNDLVALYCGADAFVFPSTHEGFGIPVLEARACGTNVVATDIPELREAGGDDAIYVVPTVDGIRTGILRALSQKKKPATVPPKPNTWAQSGCILGELLLTGETSGKQ
jgi:glycosyltransferase involved in cell wall biosynthesis